MFKLHLIRTNDILFSLFYLEVIPINSGKTKKNRSFQKMGRKFTATQISTQPLSSFLGRDILHIRPLFKMVAFACLPPHDDRFSFPSGE